MSRFPCTRCGTTLEDPAPGASVACPNCGRQFLAPEPLPPELAPRPSRYDRDQQQAWDETPFEPAGPRGNSGVGVASFLIGLIVAVIDVLLFLFLFLVGGSGSNLQGRDTVRQLAFLFNCIGLMAAFIGLGLGAAGLFQEYRRRTLAVVGVILNGLVILLVTGALLAVVAIWRAPF
ncbi:MAG: Zn-ribbon domain-containing protein [Gemmataceae bacterium]|nr:Zn-ribbon domain-containing protein [Gemmataceae bacterium]